MVLVAVVLLAGQLAAVVLVAVVLVAGQLAAGLQKELRVVAPEHQTQAPLAPLESQKPAPLGLVTDPELQTRLELELPELERLKLERPALPDQVG